MPSMSGFDLVFEKWPNPNQTVACITHAFVFSESNPMVLSINKTIETILFLSVNSLHNAMTCSQCSMVLDEDLSSFLRFLWGLLCKDLQLHLYKIETGVQRSGTVKTIVAVLFRWFFLFFICINCHWIPNINKNILNHHLMSWHVNAYISNKRDKIP